jgi:hypothetical protein
MHLHLHQTHTWQGLNYEWLPDADTSMLHSGHCTQPGGVAATCQLVIALDVLGEHKAHLGAIWNDCFPRFFIRLFIFGVSWAGVVVLSTRALQSL